MLRRSNEALEANDGNINTAKGCRLCKCAGAAGAGIANRNGYEMTTPADAGFAGGWVRTSFGSEDHADWTQGGSRI
jgi:hypothetical protein